MSKIIDDEFLYLHIPQAERVLLDRIPSENELSHQFSIRFKRKMKALLKYERRTPTMRQVVSQLKKVLAILFIAVSITFGTVISVEAYRVRFFEFVIQILEDLTSIVIHSSENADYDTLMPIFPSYLPSGYKILEQESNEYKNYVVYSDESGEEIYYLQKLASQSAFIFDSEDVKPKEITIKSQKGYLIVNKGTAQLYWYDDFSIFSLIGKVDDPELIKMAESIIEKAKK